MVSGEVSESLPNLPLEWIGRNVTVQSVRDRQTYSHIDTPMPAVKVWLFQPGVTLDQGPLHYVKGSKRNTYGKLQWMHAYAQPPAEEALQEPSFRLRGSDMAASK